jgi:hypothetical protein
MSGILNYKRKTLYFHEMPTEIKLIIKIRRKKYEKWQETIYRILTEQQQLFIDTIMEDENVR